MVVVLLYHAEVPGFGGGYVGVDVFFVISGFLITGLLITEAERTGSIDLRRFYTRRIRRLLPVSATVTAAVLIAAWATYPPLRLAEFRAEALAAIGYVANLFYAAASRDYLANVAASPFQHYWSLAIEEQFYLVWPVLLVAAIATARRAGRDLRIDARVAVSMVVASSFLGSVVLTPMDRAAAFFLPPTRAWELGVGALLALLPSRALTIPRRGWVLAAGLAAIGLSVVVYDAGTVFPGVAASLPVLGTAAVILARQERQPLLSWSVSQWIGRRSYALYLWHWPVLVFVPTESLAMRMLLLGVSVVLAAATFRLIESPLRHHPGLTGRRVVAAGTLVTGVSVIAALLVTVQPTFDHGPPTAPATADAVPGLLAAPAAAIPDNLRPSLEGVRDALPAVYDDGCHLEPVQTTVDGCVYGDPSADVTVVLFGDSHAAQWFPALVDLADRQEWRLVSLTKSSCPPIDMPPEVDRDHDRACRTWLDHAIERIDAEEPELVVLGAHSYGYEGRLGLSLEVWLDGLARAMGRLTVADRVVLMGAVPEFPHDVPVCLSANLDDPASCRADAEDVLDPRMQPRERQAVASVDAAYVDTRPWVCPQRACPVIAGDVLMYRDRHHLTPTYVRLLAPAIGRAITGSPRSSVSPAAPADGVPSAAG